MRETKMPSNYTDYDPAQPLSPEQVAALSEVTKIIEARLLYNKNLLEFMLNKENEVDASALLKTLLPQADSLLKAKKTFIPLIVNECKYYNRYLQHIKTCKTIIPFDELYFQIFMRSEANQYNLTTVLPKLVDSQLKAKNVSGRQRKKLLEDSEALS